MSTFRPEPAPRPVRHALNLPAGSIRALLAFGVLGYLWILALKRDQAGKPLLTHTEVSLPFIYLQFLMVLILASFFAAHGATIGSHVSERSPLGLPRGSVYLGFNLQGEQAAELIDATAPVTDVRIETV